MQATDIKLNIATKNITVTFDTGDMFSYPAEFLRVYSPSAEVRGHSMEPPKLIYGRKKVGIIALKAIGNYAIKINFDDLHDTGIYSWDYLYDLGVNYEAYWDMYVKRLKADNKTREPKSSPIKNTKE